MVASRLAKYTFSLFLLTSCILMHNSFIIPLLLGLTYALIGFKLTLTLLAINEAWGIMINYSETFPLLYASTIPRGVGGMIFVVFIAFTFQIVFFSIGRFVAKIIRLDRRLKEIWG